MKKEIVQVLVGIGSMTALTMAGTGISSIYAQSASGKPTLKQMNIYLDNKLVSTPKGIYAIDPNSHKYTTYMPIWYIMYALKAINVQTGWDGTNWQITLPNNIKPNFKSGNVNSSAFGNGKVDIWIDGTLVQRDVDLVFKDPSSNIYTTYVPIWYVGDALNYFGIKSTWDGVNWKMTLTNGANTGNGWGSLSGLTGTVTNTVNNTVGGVANTVGNVTNTLGNTTNTSGGLNNPIGGVTNILGGPNTLGGVTNTLSGINNVTG